MLQYYIRFKNLIVSHVYGTNIYIRFVSTFKLNIVIFILYLLFIIKILFFKKITVKGDQPITGKKNL